MPGTDAHPDSNLTELRGLLAQTEAAAPSDPNSQIAADIFRRLLIAHLQRNSGEELGTVE